MPLFRDPAAASRLPPGEHSYESVLDGVRDGRYRFARIRAASGRLNVLIGVSPEQLAALRREARRAGVGFLLLGSRVSGPRLRQGRLDPLLRDALPLAVERRSASATYPEVTGVTIAKSAIKEFGLDDPRTSDLSVFLVDASRAPAELDRLAAEIERRLRGLGCSFPLRVFSRLGGYRFPSEDAFVAMGVDYLRARLAAPAPRARLARAYGELYARVNVRRCPFGAGDAVNGLIGAALLSASFALTLGLRPVVPAAGFAFGLVGRHLARLRAWVAREPCDSVWTNSAALAADAAIGVATMAWIINPLGGFGIAGTRILGASLLHAASKGSVRLFLDKRFAQRALADQRLGVAASLAANFLIGMATAGVYAGSRGAAAFESAVAAVGLLLVYRSSVARALAAVRAAAALRAPSAARFSAASCAR